MGYYITKSYCLCLKSFKWSLLAATMSTFWQAILVSIKLESLLFGNIISQALKMMLRPMLKAATFVWP